MLVKYTLGTNFVKQYKISRLDARAIRLKKKADFVILYYKQFKGTFSGNGFV